jgi:peptide chain release factor subunit 1
MKRSMALVVTTDRLRQLAGFTARNGCAISLSLGFDPSTAGTLPGAATKIKALLDEAEKTAFAASPRLGHGAKAGLRADFARIRDFFENEFDRSGVRGLVLFAAGLDDLWSVVPLGEPVPDAVHVGSELFIRPLLPLLGRGDGTIVAVVDRERGVLFRLNGARLDEVADHTEEQPGRHDQGGWSQARYQRHIDELAMDHWRTVADDLDARIHAGEARRVVVIGPEEARAAFCELLATETREALIGATSGEGYATPAELYELVLPFVERTRRAEQAELLARWQEEAARNGRAASGWTETLEAASDARVDVLLYAEGASHPAYVCPTCGRAVAEDGTCPLDGVALERRDDGVDVAARLVLVHGGWVVALPRDRPELGPFGGIAALLRF